MRGNEKRWTSALGGLNKTGHSGSLYSESGKEGIEKKAWRIVCGNATGGGQDRIAYEKVKRKRSEEIRIVEGKKKKAKASGSRERF